MNYDYKAVSYILVCGKRKKVTGGRRKRRREEEGREERRRVREKLFLGQLTTFHDAGIGSLHLCLSKVLSYKDTKNGCKVCYSSFISLYAFNSMSFDMGLIKDIYIVLENQSRHEKA